MAKSRVRVLLVTPPYHAGVVESAGSWMPLGLVYLAGHARRAGAEVRLFDAMSLFLDFDAIAREIESFRPHIVAVPTITAAEPDARLVCATAKRVDPHILTVVGGVHATFCWQELLEGDENIDVAVRGEGEETFAEIVHAVGAGSDGLERIAGLAFRREDGTAVATQTRPFASDLDALVAAWDLLDWPHYFYRPNPEGRFAIVSSSRGCCQACTFCSQQKLWARTWRSRKPESFVAELEMLRSRYDVRVAMLADETPTVDRERWERILDLLAERRLGIELLMETRVDDILRDEDLLPKYHAASVDHIYVGVEAASQPQLDYYQKNTKVAESKRAIELINAHQIISETSFVLGTPEETKASIRATVELAKWYDPDMAFFLALTPWPYADIYPQLAPHVAHRDYRRYNLVEPVVKPTAMTLDEVRTELHRATGHFFRDKFMRLDELAPFKRSYLVSVLKLLIENSYLGHEMHTMAAGAEMPEPVRRMLAALNISNLVAS